MFTGLVETMGKLVSLQDSASGKRLVLDAAAVADHVQLGDSIAVNGCCLTVVSVMGDELQFDVGNETLSRTNLGALHPGDRVNLERSLTANSRIGGHFVTGHIDCTGLMVSRIDDADWSTCWFEVPVPWSKYLASKGSVAVDGVSLTLVDVQTDRFSVALIPHTLQMTNLGIRQPGDKVNIETDVLAKYVERILQCSLAAGDRTS